MVTYSNRILIVKLMAIGLTYSFCYWILIVVFGIWICSCLPIVAPSVFPLGHFRPETDNYNIKNSSFHFINNLTFSHIQVSDTLVAIGTLKGFYLSENCAFFYLLQFYTEKICVYYFEELSSVCANVSTEWLYGML